MVPADTGVMSARPPSRPSGPPEPSRSRQGRLSDDASAAGGGAAAEHARRRAARDERLTGRFGRLGAVIAAVSDDPATTSAWKRGADGERAVARILQDRLETEGVVLFHDRAIPGRRTNIDHLAVGPAGVTVIDTKNLTGRVRVRRRGGLFGPRTEHLVVAGRDRTNLVEAVARQGAVVEEALIGTEFHAASVRGVICLADVDGLPLLGNLSVDGIRIVGPRGAARIAAHEGPLDALAVRRLAAIVNAAFPPYDT